MANMPLCGIICTILFIASCVILMLAVNSELGQGVTNHQGPLSWWDYSNCCENGVDGKVNIDGEFGEDEGAILGSWVVGFFSSWIGIVAFGVNDEAEADNETTYIFGVVQASVWFILGIIIFLGAMGQGNASGVSEALMQVPAMIMSFIYFWLWVGVAGVGTVYLLGLGVYKLGECCWQCCSSNQVENVSSNEDASTYELSETSKEPDSVPDFDLRLEEGPSSERPGSALMKEFERSDISKELENCFPQSTWNVGPGFNSQSQASEEKEGSMMKNDVLRFDPWLDPNEEEEDTRRQTADTKARERCERLAKAEGKNIASTEEIWNEADRMIKDLPKTTKSGSEETRTLKELELDALLRAAVGADTVGTQMEFIDKQWANLPN